MLLAQVSLVQDDIILARATAAPAGAADPFENARQQLLSDPIALRRLEAQNPQIAQAVRNPAEFRRFLQQIEAQKREAERQAALEEQMLQNADPFDIEAQRKIEEAIKKENVNRNWETAMEFHPESFGRVVMLYINVEVNGVPLKAFVDSGAQATIMSPDCAEKCKIMHLLDERFSGIAEGVGTAKILGRVHSAQLKVGKQFLACSFTIMEGRGVDFLFGLDMLKRHLACIDLAKNCLRIHDEEIPFLPEHEVPLKDKDRTNEQAVADSTNLSSAGNAVGVPVPTASSAPLGFGSQPAAPVPAPAAAGTAANTARYPEEVIQGLMDLGVTREYAIAVLEQCNGNAELAANILFG
ncbi:DNA damage-inducible protein 1 [Blyttiomyces sp. JEL0837]|nr:DNA damage-inducible protein 1 [Blyttiomyces sp. JEL0837]